VGVYTSKGTFMPLREKGDESSTDLSSPGDD
jgi:hypothetical protein